MFMLLLGIFVKPVLHVVTGYCLIKRKFENRVQVSTVLYKSNTVEFCVLFLLKI